MIHELSEFKIEPRGIDCFNCSSLYFPDRDQAIVTFIDGQLGWWHSKIAGGCPEGGTIT